MKTKLAAIAFLCCILFASLGISAENIPKPQIDERVELLGIVFRLAGSPEYQCQSFHSYNDDINRHFAKFKNHKAVLLAKTARWTTGVGYDAVVSFAVHLAIEDGHVVLPTEDSDKTLKALDPRWLITSRMFAEALDDFYIKSRFHEFFDAHKEMYRKTEEKFAEISDKVDYDWFGRFYGKANVEHFRLILNLMNENNGYGPKCHFKDGHEEFYAILGVSGPDLNYGEGLIPWLVHEFNHSFCNPLIEKHLKELKPAADRLFPYVGKKMTQQAYPFSSTMLYEYLVRACEIRYLQEHEKKDEATRRLQDYQRNGFLWLDELVLALERYENEREKYPNLESFMPEIVKLQDSVITDEFIAKLKNRPKVVSTNPPNGSKKVDPTITEMSVTFDRPMNIHRYSWCTNDGGKTFPPTKEKEAKIHWSDDKKTCFLGTLDLSPGKTYNIWINLGEIDYFRSEEGITVEPLRFTFTTK